jgi:TonB family protein
MNTHANLPGDKDPRGKQHAHYGVAELRATYTATLLKSLGFTFTSVATITAVVLFTQERRDVLISEIAGQDDSVYVIPFFPIDPADPPQKPNDNRSTRAAAGDETYSKEIRDSVTTESTFTATAVAFDSSAIASDASSAGAGAIESGAGAGAETAGSAHGTGMVMNDFEVTEMPEFEGGLKALYKFLKARTRYPEKALQEGREASVHVRFVVDEEGRVSDVSLLNSAGREFDDEAMRVVRLLPKFSRPARVNGRAVKVYYRVPFTFRCR